MANNLTKKQKEFADEYLETGNATQSALKVYSTDDYNTAGVIGHENLNKPKIIEYFDSKSSEVAKNMYHLALNAKSEGDQIKAGKDVLDRAGYKPVEKKDLTSGGKTMQVIFDNSFGERYAETNEENL